CDRRCRSRPSGCSRRYRRDNGHSSGWFRRGCTRCRIHARAKDAAATGQRASAAAPPVKVIQTVAALNEELGGPSRSVPALCDALSATGIWTGLFSQRLANLSSPEISPRSEGVELCRVDGRLFRSLNVAYSARAQAELVRMLSTTGAELVHD